MRRRLLREDGQLVLMLATGLLIALLAVAALVVDIGRAYVVKRQLQATADAVAVTAADALPAATTAVSTGTTYGPTGKNPVPGMTVAQTVKPWCLKSITYCYGNTPNTAPANGQANGVVVTEAASVPTTFAKLFGIGSINVNAKSTACGMCSSQPLDIALVLDRTGSMSDNMTDLRDGAKTFLSALDPRLDYVTLLVLPPTVNGASCTNAGAYPAGSDSSYTIVSTRMSHDYLVNGALNSGSNIVKAIDCLTANGSTSYKQALIQANDELVNHGSGRQNVQRVIVFESDGAANAAPASYMAGFAGLTFAAPGHEDDLTRPCGSSVDYASTLKASGTEVYTVAYAVGPSDICQRVDHWLLSGITLQHIAGAEGTTAPTALQQIASPGDAVSQAQAGDMSASFQKIANKLMGARLVPDDEGG